MSIGEVLELVKKNLVFILATTLIVAAVSLIRFLFLPVSCRAVSTLVVSKQAVAVSEISKLLCEDAKGVEASSFAVERDRTVSITVNGSDPDVVLQTCKQITAETSEEAIKVFSDIEISKLSPSEAETIKPGLVPNVVSPTFAGFFGALFLIVLLDAVRSDSVSATPDRRNHSSLKKNDNS